MSSFIESTQDFNLQHALSPFAQGEDLPLADILTVPDIERILAEENVSFGKTSRSFWTFPITLSTFLWQMLGPASLDSAGKRWRISCSPWPWHTTPQTSTPQGFAVLAPRFPQWSSNGWPCWSATVSKRRRPRVGGGKTVVS